MKPEISITEYNALSEEDKGDYTRFCGADTVKYILLPKLKPVPDTVKAPVVLDGVTLDVDIKTAAEYFLFKLDGRYEDSDDAFVGGAYFGAHWQKSQFKQAVIQLLEVEQKQYNSDFTEWGLIDSLISKIKAL